MTPSETSSLPIENRQHHKPFLRSARPHVLQITNHGIHEWNVIPGLPDTGGQNVFVNHMTAALAKLGFKITIANRGGYPHPRTESERRGLDYKDEHRRIVFLEDDTPEFVRKEDMKAHISGLTEWLRRFLETEDALPDLIVSHYWDAAAIGVALNDTLPSRRKHIWVPHSLGALKKHNVDPSTWEDLRIEERIEEEKRLLSALDGVAVTSGSIRDALRDDYGRETDIFLPPCVDPDVFHPRKIADDDEIWSFLADQTGLAAEQVRGARIVTEISRTDKTKRKDVLIRAFAEVRKRVDNALLLLTVDPDVKPLADELHELAEQQGLTGHIAFLGSIWEYLPRIYAITDIYCTPSVMEGFGMSIQEAAATGVPAVASDLVPFAVEYLLGESAPAADGDESALRIREGDAAIVVAHDDTAGFARALGDLLEDDGRRRSMGENAYKITIPAFTWDRMTKRFIESAGLSLP